jgi:hypothetical protein
MSIKFLHVRPKNEEGTPDSKGGTTFAFEVGQPFTQEGTGAAFVLLKYSVARCHSEKQTFSRAIGRAVAEGRYNKGHIVAAEIPVNEDGHTYDSARDYLAHL